MNIIKYLGDGLVMRQAELSDTERLAAFNARIHGEDPYDAEAVAVWTRDLFLRPPPGYSPGDFVVIENTANSEIVSSLNLISQTWSYEGIPFGVGRPELVGTDPAYRGRGLVREAFAVIHEWSRQRGELLQIITGIPYFYRQFGYEMGLDLGGGRAGYAPHLPALGEGQAEEFAFRRAGVDDLPFIMKMYERECRRSMISAVRDEAAWHNELFEKSRENVNRFDVFVIQGPDGRPVGYLVMAWYLWGTSQTIIRYELDEDVSFLSVTPPVLRFAWKVGQENAAERGKTLEAFAIQAGAAHPAYQACPGRFVVPRTPYAYYVRVADLPAFIRRITPVLEQRLCSSVCSGYSGELKISFYRQGVRLAFQDGRLDVVEPWKPGPTDEGHAAFPDLTFLQLLFGYRSLEELRYAFVDCWANRDAPVLLDALFPKKPSSVWAVA